MKKKQKGAIDSFLYVIVTITVLLVFVVALLPCFRILQARNDINQIARRYLLIMETEGYLPGEEENQLRKELLALPGVQQVVIHPGTTLSMAGYGEEVVLDFSVVYTNTTYDISDILLPVVGTENLNVHFRKCSIAKH